MFLLFVAHLRLVDGGRRHIGLQLRVSRSEIFELLSAGCVVQLLSHGSTYLFYQLAERSRHGQRVITHLVREARAQVGRNLVNQQV